MSQQSSVSDNPVMQETNAETAGPIPPSYDPAWAQPGTPAQVAVDRDEISPAPHSPISSEVGYIKR